MRKESATGRQPPHIFQIWKSSADRDVARHRPSSSFSSLQKYIIGYYTSLFFLFHYVMMMNMNIKGRHPRQYEPSHSSSPPIMFVDPCWIYSGHQQLFFDSLSLSLFYHPHILDKALCSRRQISFRLTVRTRIVFLTFTLDLAAIVPTQSSIAVNTL